MRHSFETVAAIPDTKPAGTPEPPVQEKPLLIVFKPKPVYPEEARRARIEGEVLLEACFDANGRIRVLRVIRGLGRELDRSAIEAAEHIRFLPAERQGQTIDTIASVRITFSLAY